MSILSKKDKKSFLRISACVMPFIAAVCGLFSYALGILPLIWVLLLFGLSMLLFVYRFFKSLSLKHGLSRFLTNILLSALLILSTFGFASLRKEGEDIISSGRENIQTVHFYVLNENYKKTHDWKNTDMSDDIRDYEDDLFVLTRYVENQRTALNVLSKEMGFMPETVIGNDVIDAAGKIYSGAAKVLVMSQDYADTLKHSYLFSDFAKDTKIIYSVKVEHPEAELSADDFNTPFSFYIAGSDTRDGRLSFYDRFDVNMLVSVNPQSRQAVLVSIPRDAYLKNPAYSHGKDKLTHMGINGISNAMTCLSETFDVAVNNYAVVDFETFKGIIDAIGGIDLHNPYAFEATEAGVKTGYSFPQGNIHLNGDEALAFVRERYTLPNGDFDRNVHQSLVLSAIFKKMTNPLILLRMNEVMKALKGSFLTNADEKRFVDFVLEQLPLLPLWDVQTVHMSGATGSSYCVSAARNLSVVHLYDTEIAQISEVVDCIYKGLPYRLLEDETK